MYASLRAIGIEQETVTKPEAVVEPEVTGDDPWEKRYKDLQSYKDKVLQEKEEELSNLKAQLESQAVSQLPKTKEEIDAYKEQNPEIFDIIQSIAKMELIEKDKEFSSKLEELEKAKEQIVVQEKATALLEIHPDAKEIKDSDDFKTWYKNQSKNIKALFDEKNPVDDIAKGFEFYKTIKGISESKAKAAEQVVTSSKGEAQATPKRTYSNSEIMAMDSIEFAKNKDDIYLAFKEGRVTKN